MEIGTRVRDQEGFRGTVRYIGPVATAKNKDDIWLGVEWDKSDRGKHDGSVVDSDGNLHKYFEVSSPLGGSFVKGNKVTAGCSFTDALRRRYVKEDAPMVAPNSIIPDAFVVTSKGKQKSIEFVGEQKIRKWQQIETVNKIAMRDDEVSSAGDDIAECASHLIEVDLQDNLLWQWSEVAKLSNQMPGLRTLLLHENRLQKLTAEIVNQLPLGCFAGLRVLALNACNITSWSSIAILDPLLPFLEELYLAGNCLPDLPCAEAAAAYEAATGEPAVVAEPLNGFETLRLLDISSCRLEEWSQVEAFGRFPNLKELLLDGNPLRQVLPVKKDQFCALQRISISSSSLSAWSDVDAISTFPAIVQLRLSHVPLFAGKGASEVRPIVISRIENLTFFNGSGIGHRERIDAEKAYLRSVIREIESNKAMGLQLDVATAHPRFEELQAKHGKDLLPMGQEAAGATLAADLLTITFQNLSFASGGGLEPVEKKLPRSLAINRLRLMVKQLFGLDPELQHLSLRNYNDAPPTLLDDDQATLGYFGAVDGATVFINEAKSASTSK